jgi:hypothetical protein
MSGLRAVLRVADAGSGVGWTRLCDYTEPVAGELARREPAVAGIPLILSWSGTLTVDGSRFDAGFVAGPADRYADTLTTGHAHGVQVDLTWLGGRRLLGLPPQELAYRNLAVEEVWGREGRLLLDRLAGTRSPGARLDLVEAFLRTRALCPDTVPPVVAGAVALLNRHRGRLAQQNWRGGWVTAASMCTGKSAAIWGCHHVRSPGCCVSKRWPRRYAPDR